MSLISPNLDDRRFEDLLEEAKKRITQTCPEWTDLEPGNPGMVLLELFAHLTEIMIYRLNRVPKKAYIEFLRLMGIKMHPPSSASVELCFSTEQPPEQVIEIPRGTRVTITRSSGGTEPPAFVTDKAVKINPGETEVNVTAHHGELIEGELIGKSNGAPGQYYSVSRPPIVAPTKEGLELLVGIEVSSGTLGERVQSINYNNKTFRIWRETENFTNIGPDPYIYLVDRLTGTIIFAPAIRTEDQKGQFSNTPQTLAATPPLDSEIRVWYRRGGGIEGNVGANNLTVLKDSIVGVMVNNPKPATGGRAAESLENVLIRGPQELHSLQRAVTASDFELLAQRSGSVGRAKAVTRSRLWRHATPGTVEVLLVPYLPEEKRGTGQVTPEVLKEQQTKEAYESIRELLEERRPLGTTCIVSWVQYKTVRIKARVIVYPGENPIAVKERVIERLHGTINPLPTKIQPTGWQFGQPLRVSNVYDIMLSEAGVNYIDRVELFVDEVPAETVSSVAADAFQERTWYAVTGQKLFRSQDDGHGWELIANFPDEEIKLIKVHPNIAGLLVVVTHLVEQKSQSNIYISKDCGESWHPEARTEFRVEDVGWLTRENVPVLLMATNVGLFELVIQPRATPVQILVDPQNQDLGFFSIAVSLPIRGPVSVAVASRGSKGIFLSREGGRSNSFSNIGLDGNDVRVIEVNQDGVRTFLWAGVTVSGNEAGVGCFSVEITDASINPRSGWSQYQTKWAGGSCRSIAFMGSQVLAATYYSGVLMLDSSKSKKEWTAPVVGCGLPIRDTNRTFQPTDTVAADPEGRLFLIGGPEGVYRSENGLKYEDASSKIFPNIVTLPGTWLFCSGDHEIEVLSEHEANRD